MSLEAPPSVGVPWALWFGLGPVWKRGFPHPRGTAPGRLLQPHVCRSGPREDTNKLSPSPGLCGGETQTQTGGDTLETTRLAQQRAEMGPVFPAP